MPSPAILFPSWHRPVGRWLGSKRSFNEALARALSHDDAPAVRALLARGLPVVSTGPGRASPLRLAVHHDAAAAVLLDAGADPTAPGMVWVQSAPAAKAWIDTYPVRCAAREARALDALLACPSVAPPPSPSAKESEEVIPALSPVRSSRRRL